MALFNKQRQLIVPRDGEFLVSGVTHRQEALHKAGVGAHMFRMVRDTANPPRLLRPQEPEHLAARHLQVDTADTSTSGCPRAPRYRFDSPVTSIAYWPLTRPSFAVRECHPKGGDRQVSPRFASERASRPDPLRSTRLEGSPSGRWRRS